MIIDIVQLPRRLSQFKGRKASIDSKMLVGYPTPTLARTFGYWGYDDTPAMQLGSLHILPTGPDAMFRYKFIEPTRHGLAEYLVLTTSPIDVRHPLGNKKIELICPFVTITDPKTYMIRKFILWNGVFDLVHYETEDNIKDVPVEHVIIQEVLNFAKENNRPDIIEDVVRSTKTKYGAIITEEPMCGNKAVDRLLQLGSNIQAYNTMMVDNEPYYWCDPADVLRDVNVHKVCTDMTILDHCTILPHFVYGKTSMGDLRFLFGVHYDAHAFQRVFNLNRMNEFTEISVQADDPDMFAVMENIASLPYSEFQITADANGLYDVKLYNQYDIYLPFKNGFELSKEAKDQIVKAISILRSTRKDIVNIEITRSYGEEIYITIKRANSTERFYFDLVSVTLGSRAVIRDYCGYLF